MIIKTAILLLKVYDAVCDAYDWSKVMSAKLTKHEAYNPKLSGSAKPSYSISSYNR